MIDEQEESKRQRRYGQYAIRALKATGRGMLAFVSWADRNNGFITASATVFIAILTGLYVHYSGAQWKVMRDQLPELHTSAQAAKDAAKAAEQDAALLQLDERAWFGTSDVVLKSSRTPRQGESLPLLNDVVIARVRFINTGKTPAMNVRIASTGFVDPVEKMGEKLERYNFGFPIFTARDYILGGNVPPGGMIYRDVPTVPAWRLNKQNLKSLREPTHRMIFAGRGTYNDVITPKVTHWFTFCYFLMPKDGVFAVYPRFNDMGDEGTK